MTSQTFSFRHVVVFRVAVEVSANSAQSSPQTLVRNLDQERVHRDVIVNLTVSWRDQRDVTELRLPHADVELDER